MSLIKTSQKKLSICIPTFNRSVYLRNLLNSLRFQVRDVGAVEVCVSDNYSTDDTSAVIGEFQALGMPLRYHVQDRNVGGDLNILAAIKMSEGYYSWLIGDDDEVVEGAVVKMLELIKCEPSLIVANARGYDVTLSNPGSLVFRGGHVCDRDAALISLGPWITFISSLCFNRMEFLKNENLYLSEIASKIAHSFVVLKIIRQGTVIITEEEMVRFRGGNSGGYDLYTVFIKEAGRLLSFAVEQGFSPDGVAVLRQEFIKKVIAPCTLQYRLNGIKLPGVYLSLKITIQSRVGFFLKAYVIGIRFAPIFLLRAAKVLRVVWRKRVVNYAF